MFDYSCSGVRLKLVTPGTGDSSFRPSGSVMSRSNPPGWPLKSGATMAFTWSPALIMFDFQPTRDNMLMLVSSIV